MGDLLRASRTESRPARVLVLLALLVVAAATRMAWRHADQPPLDVHSFRQSQTALTAFWAAREGFRLPYETPVAGLPWAIPFEFPLYQWLVAGLSRLTGAGIDRAGRLLSFGFLLACLFPVRDIVRRLSLPRITVPIFACLLFTSPLYLYWGRSLMIETTAVFLALLAIRYFVELEIGPTRPWVAWAFAVAMALCLLQKATTGLPVVLLLGLLWMVLHIRRAGASVNAMTLSAVWRATLLFLIPLFIAYVWTRYTDQVKALSPLGASLTSSALAQWNWGTLEQRLSADLYRKVLWERMFVGNLSAQLGVALLFLPLLARGDTRLRVVVLSCLLMGIGPLLIFTNLHLVHDYYQTANLVFLLFAVALALSVNVAGALGERVAIGLLAIFMVSGVSAFLKDYMPTVRARFDAGNSRDVAVAELVRRHTGETDQFVAFGNDWSSTIAYLAHRKSFTVPRFFSGYEEVVLAPERFVDKDRLGAVVTCPGEGPSLERLLAWTGSRANWMIGETQGCFVAVRASEPETSSTGTAQEPAVCQGDLSVQTVAGNAGQILVGWSLNGMSDGRAPGALSLSLVPDGGEGIVLSALAVHRADVLTHLSEPRPLVLGLSRVLPVPLAAGRYSARLTRLWGAERVVCRFDRPVVVPAAQ
jgi:hypothetical protein